jgi:urease accessory protein UreF
MVNSNQLALNDAAEWLGVWHPLAEQLGSADSLVTLSSVSRMLNIQPVSDRRSLELFLRHYHDRVLVASELPAIQNAYSHATRNELRELVALDRELEQDQVLDVFRDPSRRVGQTQLQKLRPLRDQRFVQRYLQAVESGQANGWHTLVYGVTLWIYSLPLRQGLLGYAHHTTRGFIYSAAWSLRLSERDCRRLFDDLSPDLPAAVENLLREPAVA